jgi:predicted lipoprotein with Yx(FWY)xxD motif
MKRTYVLGGVLAAAVLAGGGAALGTALASPAPAAAPAAAGGQASPASAAPAAPVARGGIGTAALAPGTALVDGAGRAVYLFEADTGAMSTCTGPCAQVWPPLPAQDGQPTVAGAAQTALVGTTQRADGTRQLTYNGHPLYYFAGDKAPGDSKGQGLNNFGGGWYVVAPNGNKIDPDDPAPAGPPPAPSRAVAPSSGYGY